MLVALAALLAALVNVAHADTSPSMASKPANPTRSTVARFSFLDAHIGVTLVCSLDGSGYRACSSPKTYRGLAAGEHTFSVKTTNSVGGKTAGTSYSWAIDRKPPSIKITSPRNGRIYGRHGWSTGCGRRRAGICGTASDSVGLASVRVSIKRNSTGKYWNGSGFNAGKAVYLRARLSRRRRNDSPKRRRWFYPIRLPSRDGAYTLHVRAKDRLGNASIRRYSWRVVSSLPLDLSGEVASVSAMLYPGLAALGIPLTISNPNAQTIYVTTATASLRSTGAVGCSASWFQIAPASIPPGGIAVPPHGSVTLPAQGAAAPTIRLIESGTDQDACQNASLMLTYSAGAHR